MVPRAHVLQRIAEPSVIWPGQGLSVCVCAGRPARQRLVFQNPCQTWAILGAALSRRCCAHTPPAGAVGYRSAGLRRLSTPADRQGLISRICSLSVESHPLMMPVQAARMGERSAWSACSAHSGIASVPRLRSWRTSSQGQASLVPRTYIAGSIWVQGGSGPLR